jgi:alpha-galactosidase
VGGNCWRTTGDISDNWNSMSSIGFGQNGHEKYAGPGHWNDPDMLVVGYVGWGHLHPTHLTPDEQYTHITLWSLLSAPLLIGCDMTRMDDFTRSLLTNDEVLAVNQDALGKPAGRIVEDVEHGGEIWARPLADGTMAVGIFNRGRYVYQPFRKNNRNPSARAVWRIYDRYEKKAQEFDSEQAAKEAYKALCGPSQIIVKWSDLKLNGKQKVRDLWSQKDAGEFPDQFSVTVPFHGAALIKVGTPK